MTDETAAAAPPPLEDSPGRLLRRAREAQGMHIAVLAASLKVPPRKLELLEQDRFDELPDLAFVRALAQSVCRVLKIDPTPVMALLPHARESRLDHVAEGLNTPFRERPSTSTPVVAGWAGRPVLWVVLLLLVGAAALALWPSRSRDSATETLPPAGLPAPSADVAPGTASESEPVPTPAALPIESPLNAASGADASPATGTQPVPAAGAAPGDAGVAVAPAGEAAAASAAPAVAAPGLLQLSAEAETWVEVTDASGRRLLSRIVAAGETVGLDGTAPFQLVVGNAPATKLMYRGQPVDLGPYTRDNIARFKLP
jgi:cytoskeleton protein RodZ